MGRPNMPALHEMFGSAAEMARLAGSSRSAVTRWGRYQISPKFQKRLIEAAFDLDLNIEDVARCVGIDCCPACGSYHINGKTIANHPETKR